MECLCYDQKVRPKLNIATIVWGSDFVELGRRFAWSSLLAPQNLPAIANEFEVTMTFHTTGDDARRIRQLPEFEAIGRYATVKINEFVPSAIGLNFATYTSVYCESLLIPISERAMYLLFNPDCVMADGSLPYLVKCLHRSRVFMAWSGRISFELLGDALESFRIGPILSVPKRDLVKISFSCAHPEMVTYSVSDNLIPTRPTNLIWMSPDKASAVVRTHTLGPTAINFGLVSPRDSDSYLRNLRGSRNGGAASADEAATLKALLRDMDGVYISQDSDNFFWNGITDSGRFADGIPWSRVSEGRLSLRNSIGAYQQLKSVNEYSRLFVTVPFVLRGSAESDWITRTVEETELLVNSVSIVTYSQKRVARLLSADDDMGQMSALMLLALLGRKGSLGLLRLAFRGLASPFNFAVSTKWMRGLARHAVAQNWPGSRVLHQLSQKILELRRRL